MLFGLDPAPPRAVAPLLRAQRDAVLRLVGCSPAPRTVEWVRISGQTSTASEGLLTHFTANLRAEPRTASGPTPPFCLRAVAAGPAGRWAAQGAGPADPGAIVDEAAPWRHRDGSTAEGMRGAVRVEAVPAHPHSPVPASDLFPGPPRPLAAPPRGVLQRTAVSAAAWMGSAGHTGGKRTGPKTAPPPFLPLPPGYGHRRPAKDHVACPGPRCWPRYQAGSTRVSFSKP